MSPDPVSKSKLPQPPSPARDWVRLVLAFGIAVAVGLAPFLGTFDVPGFRALLTLFPRLPWDTTRNIIPFSSFLMGVVAVIVQAGMLKPGKRRRIPVWVMGVLLVAFVLLLVTHTLLVRFVEIRAVESSLAVLVGFDRPSTCECQPQLSDAACLRQLTLNPDRIQTCWGDRALQTAFLSLALPYLTVTGMFGIMVGYLPLKRPGRRSLRKPHPPDSAPVRERE